jgi:hypothetical protein
MTDQQTVPKQEESEFQDYSDLLRAYSSEKNRPNNTPTLYDFSLFYLLK